MRTYTLRDGYNQIYWGTFQACLKHARIYCVNQFGYTPNEVEAQIGLILLDRKYRQEGTYEKAKIHPVSILTIVRSRSEGKSGYLVAFAVTREYGGPEEGGWYYTAYERLAHKPIRRSRNRRRFEIALKEEVAHLADPNHHYGECSDEDISDDAFLRQYYSPAVDVDIRFSKSIPPKFSPRPHYE